MVTKEERSECRKELIKELTEEIMQLSEEQLAYVLRRMEEMNEQKKKAS